MMRWPDSKGADAAFARYPPLPVGGVESPLLKPAARRAIESADAVYVSAASIWEVAIKARLGKIEADPVALIAAIDASGFVELPVRAEHAAGVALLAAHHSDPFDRLLIAQALAEPLKFLTADALLTAYSDIVTLV
jgi:PIN domain nuclease of toxin-antitoxin system